MSSRIKEFFTTTILTLISLCILLVLLILIDKLQIIELQKQTAQSQCTAAVYMEEAEQIKKEDAILASNIWRVKLRSYLVENGIPENQVDKFIHENSIQK